MKKFPTKRFSKHNFFKSKSCVGFTLMELLLAISIFSIIATVSSSLYIRSFSETRKSNLQNQVFDDARFIMSRLMEAVRENAIDYDEYYNQNVVIPSGVLVPNRGIYNYGQNFGRYYSAFFNPGTDVKLGFDCNSGGLRNQPNCMPLRKSIDRNTGSNPFEGKYSSLIVNTGEDAFCGSVSYGVLQGAVGGRKGKCTPPLPALPAVNGVPEPSRERVEDELYLISADATTKTIFAREAIGKFKVSPEVYALSMLKMSGVDTNGDGSVDSFVCAEGFQCRGKQDMTTVENPDPPRPLDPDCNGQGVILGELPRTTGLAATLKYTDLSSSDSNSACDPKSGGFSKDFVPISPLRMDIKALNFYITPSDDPYYAFAESNQISQPKVTIVLTVGLNPYEASPTDNLEPITLVETVSAGVTTPIPAPLLVQP
ncbi:MAG: type II secretion system protein [Candidatus Gracilibacteria bacterium]